MKYLTALCSISGTFPNWQQGGWFLLLVHSKLGRQGNEQISTRDAQNLKTKDSKTSKTSQT